MTDRNSTHWAKTLPLLLILSCAPAVSGATTVLFQPASPAVGPFPNDSLTVADLSQKTGLRISLPVTQPCSLPVGGCLNTLLLNQLDGFNVNPRVTVCFSGPVDPATLSSSLQFVSADDASPVIKANQITYDPVGNCAYAKPDRVLAQDARYLLLVNRPLLDSSGQQAQPDKAFSDCLNNRAASDYCKALSVAVNRRGLSDRLNLLSAALFTTMSATDWLEQARRFAVAHPTVLLPAGRVSSFDLSSVSSITYVPQDNTGNNTAMDVPVSVLSGVDRISFGIYLSPNFLNPSNVVPGSITTTPTNGPIAPPVPLYGLDTQVLSGFVPVSFHVFLPPMNMRQSGGFPVAVYGHGLGDTQFGAPTFIASTLAKQGIATLAIEIPGHGFGPLSYVNITGQDGVVTKVPTPGRGVPLSPGGTYGPTDGCITGGPLGVRDCGRQTAVDLSALVHALQESQGLGLNLDPAKIFYIGQSFGSTYGTLFHAVEPAVARAVLNGDGGTSIDVSRLAITARPLAVSYLGANVPSLLNVPPAPPEAYFHDSFNDNYPFRDQPVLVNSIPGAIPIQAAFEEAEWLGMLGDPLAFAPHLKTSPLPGVPAKASLFQFGYGDLEVPNPTESAVVNAADALATTWFFRFDTAVQSHPELLSVVQSGSPLPILPHRYLSNPTIFSVPAEQSIALATQLQAAAFLKGQSDPNPNAFLIAPFIGMRLFEIPQTLPETLNFIQLQP